jgi:hypothetical protein
MNTQTVKKFKWFWAWQDEQEEAWLTRMGEQGWHLHKLQGPGLYTFAAGKPRKDAYRLDFITNRKDYSSYLQLFKDAGWEHLGEMSGWQYFRHPADGQDLPEIYTDPASKAIKYRRLMIFLVVFLPILNILLLQDISAASPFAPLYLAGKLFAGFLMILYLYALIRLWARIRQLNQKPG